MTNSNSIKNINTEKIRKFMRKNLKATKSEISYATNLSFPTVTRLIDTLCLSGEISEVEEKSSTGGRCACLYSLNPQFLLYLLIQIEGTQIKWYIKNMINTTIKTDKFSYKNGLLSNLDTLIKFLEKEYKNINTIIIGIDAMVKEGIIEDNNGFNDIKGINIPKHFENLTDIPVKIFNDMNLIAMGQWYQSKQNINSSVSIYLGKTGFGAGIIINGNVWCGSSDFAGELTYLPFFDNKTNYELIDMVEFYVDIIRIYTIVINPEQIILYNNKYISNKIDEIRQKCYHYLPKNVIPNIELSNNYEADYENGLYAIAKQTNI